MSLEYLPPCPHPPQPRRRDSLPAAARRSTLAPPGPHRLSVAADNADLQSSPGQQWAVSRHSLAARGRRSSLAPSRMSGTGKPLLSRLSVGLTDALQWLGIKGKMPAAAADEAAAGPSARPSLAGGAKAAQERPALSPIQASPGLEEGSCSPEDASAAQLAAVAGEREAAASSPAAPAAAEEDEEAAAAGAASSAPAATPSETDEGDHAAASAEAAVEQLEGELAAKLQLEDQGCSGSASAAAAGEEELAEELTPLQQLLVLCGQEVGARSGAGCLLGLLGLAGEQVPSAACPQALPCARVPFPPAPPPPPLDHPLKQADPQLLPSMDALLGQHVDLKKVRKIGEGE